MTLVEILVALVVGAIIASGVSYMILDGLRQMNDQRNAMSQTDLNTEILRAISDRKARSVNGSDHAAALPYAAGNALLRDCEVSGHTCTPINHQELYLFPLNTSPTTAADYTVDKAIAGPGNSVRFTPAGKRCTAGSGLTASECPVVARAFVTIPPCAPNCAAPVANVNFKYEITVASDITEVALRSAVRTVENFDPVSLEGGVTLRYEKSNGIPQTCATPQLLAGYDPNGSPDCKPPLLPPPPVGCVANGAGARSIASDGTVTCQVFSQPNCTGAVTAGKVAYVIGLTAGSATPRCAEWDANP